MGIEVRRYDLTSSIILLAILLAACAGPGFEPVVTLLKPIDQVQVSVGYQAGAIYQVQIANELPDEISLVWNESVYVNTGGDATRLIHIASPQDLDQAPTPEQKHSAVAAHGRLRTEFVGESWIDYARRGVTPRPLYSDKKAKIYLSFHIHGKQVYWRAEVSFVPRK